MMLTSRYINCYGSVKCMNKDDVPEFRGTLTLKNTKVQCNLLW